MIKFCEDKENCTHGCNVHFNHWHNFWGLWYRQHTEPLLFDECITIEEKISVINYKLQWLIDKFQKFLKDFCTWADEVETTLENLQNQITELEKRVTVNETDIANLKQQLSALTELVNQNKTNIENIQKTITTIQTSISNINTEITNIKNTINQHNTNIEDIKNTLDNLNIDLPIQIINETDMTTVVAPKWLEWVKNICNSNGKESFDSEWEVTRRLSPNDGSDVAAGILVGRIIANVAQCKIPFIARHKLDIEEITSVEDSKAIAKTIYDFAISQNLIALLETLTSTDGFFDITLTNSYPKQLDEYKLTCSYIPFSVESTRMQGYPTFYKISCLNGYTEQYAGEKAYYIAPCNTFNVNVRLQFNANEKKAKMCVATPDIYLSWIDGWVYLYMVAELG